MATTSRTVAIKQRLVSLVAAALPGVQVVYGFPGDALEREAIYTGKARVDSTIPSSKAGRKIREEVVTVDVVIAVQDPDGDYESAEARALVLLAAVEDVLANDVTLGSLDGVQWASLGSFELTPVAWDHASGAVIVAEVETHCRLV